jgi:ADP-ribose pyrophosphatase YjhB (NUDIX family)
MTMMIREIYEALKNVKILSMQWRPYVSVAAVVERDGRFLMVEEIPEDSESVFNQPAGHLEKGETLIEAIEREVFEETVWHFYPQGVVGLYLYSRPGMDLTYLRVCFHGTCFDHEPDRPLEGGIIRVAWLSRDELNATREKLRSPMVLACIDDYLAGKRYPLDLLSHFLLDDASRSP